MGGALVVISLAALVVWVLYDYWRLPAGARKGWVSRGWSGMGHSLYVLTGRGSRQKSPDREARSSLTCSCPDFTGYRTGYRLDDPRRLCRHLVGQMFEGGGLPEVFREYREALDEAAKAAKGFYLYSHKATAFVRGRRLTVFADDYDEYAEIYEVLVFFDGKRHLYEPERGRWRDGSAPERQCRSEIIEQIEDMLPGFQPEPLPECCIRTIYRDEGKTAYHIRGEVTDFDRVRRIRGSMKHESDIFVVSAGHGEKESCSLEYHVMTGECIVSPRLQYMERAVRRWLEDEYPNPREDYLWGGF